jgi:hypothetical protein
MKLKVHYIEKKNWDNLNNQTDFCIDIVDVTKIEPFTNLDQRNNFFVVAGF